jgi:FkbH-like protein
MYAEERQRTEFEKSATGGSATNLQEFYVALKMTSYIGPVDAATLARVSQLTQKTNQFNLTTRRYSEQQILDIAGQPGQGVYWIRLTDRFGDNGIIGIAVLRCRGAEAEVDTFLLSCRVIGRGVETGFLSYLADRAREQGATKLWGMFIPTKKNAPSKDFYRQHGFTCVSEENGAQRWEIDLTAHPLAWPEWVARG